MIRNLSKLFSLNNQILRRKEDFTSSSVQYAIDALEILSAVEELLHTSDDPEEIALETLKTACTFYKGDWAGFLQMDLDLGLWTPYWWYNTSTHDRTPVLINEFESASQLPRWITAMHGNTNMIVLDAESIKESNPDEYAVYKRLNVTSVIAVPVKPRPVGFLVIRNPQRYANDCRALRMMAYVVLNAVNQKTMFDSTQMTFSPDNIRNESDILINMFGNLEIYTKRGVLKESDLNSPKIYRMIAYMLMSRKISVTTFELAAAVYPNEIVDMDNPGKNLKSLLYRFRQAFGLISSLQLIKTTPNGYRLNSQLNIMTDLEQFDYCWEVAQQTTSIIHRVELLKKAILLYKGDVLSSVTAEHWVLQTATHYRLKYHAIVNELLKILTETNDLPGVTKYATQSLVLSPENKDAYYWLIRALKKQGLSEMARSQLKMASNSLTEEEYAELTSHLEEAQPSSIISNCK